VRERLGHCKRYSMVLRMKGFANPSNKARDLRKFGVVPQPEHENLRKEALNVTASP